MGIFGNKPRTEEEIKNDVIKRLKKQGITYDGNLLYQLHFDNIQVKDMGTVKKRAMASILSIQLACSIKNGESYSQSLIWLLQLASQYRIEIDDFLPKEKILIHNQGTQPDSDVNITAQDIIEIVWTYESYWSLIWALDMITDREIVNASKVCNTERAVALIPYIYAASTDKLRSVDKIKEQLYLFYCYQWAFDEKHKNPNISTGDLNFEVVMERRRGLEWLIQPEKDWYQLVLGTMHNEMR